MPGPVVEAHMVHQRFDQEQSAPVLGVLAPVGQRPGRVQDPVGFAVEFGCAIELGCAVAG